MAMSASAEPVVRLRPVPHPYRALLSLCSDLDETPDRHVYREIQRFLNTTEDTAMGPGVGLEVGNSIYFDMPPDQFAYWTTDDAGRDMVRALVRSGHIDCFHSFGDHATTRAHAGRALDELARHGCRLGVWIDHAVAPSNFGADIMRGNGDVPGAEAYHADLTCGFGVRYVWRGRVTSVIGQRVPRRLGGIVDGAHAAASGRTLLKEVAKGLLARLGSQKYAMHAPNDVLRPVRLRDGRPVFEFLRANPCWGGVDQSATADGLADVLSDAFLTRLVARGGTAIVYTHLGKVSDRQRPFGPRTVAALRRLADEARSGRILVTTTARLLDYCRAVREANMTAQRAPDGGLVVDLSSPANGAVGAPLRWDGVCLEVADPARTRVRVDGREVAGLKVAPGGGGAVGSVSVPWPPLEFPQL